MTELATVTFEEHHGVFVAHLRGQIDMSNAETLMGMLGRAIPNTAVGMVLDVSDVIYLDSAGIRLVFELARRVRHRGQRLGLVIGKATAIQRVLQLTDVSAVVPVYGAVEEALAMITAGEP